MKDLRKILDIAGASLHVNTLGLFIDVQPFDSEIKELIKPKLREIRDILHIEWLKEIDRIKDENL